jgi:hypothetical protein
MIESFLFLLIAFLPGNWSADHAKEDIVKSDVVVLVRCVGIRMERASTIDTNGNNQTIESWRNYIADLEVGKTLKGADLGKVSIPLFIGYDMNNGSIDNFSPSIEVLTMFNSQCGYDIKANQVYILFLDKGKDGYYQPRSGPFSIGWIKPDNQICFGKLGWKWQDPIKYDEYLKTIK